MNGQHDYDISTTSVEPEQNGKRTSGSETQQERKRAKYTSRACEICRQRKIKCTGSENGQKCGRCASLGLECSLCDSATLRQSTSAQSPAMTLQERVRLLEERLSAQEDFLAQAGFSSPAHANYAPRNMIAASAEPGTNCTSRAASPGPDDYSGKLTFDAFRDNVPYACPASGGFCKSSNTCAQPAAVCTPS